MKTKLITRKGHEKLKAELNHLWHNYRPEITKKVTWAASLGDRSENADYKENKRLLRQIDSRIRYLTKRLNDLRVIDFSPEQEGKVFFGAWVVIENEEEKTMKFKIVGPDEIYAKDENYISIDSPMARALLKKSQGDEVKVQTPEGVKTWFIMDINYEKE